MAKTWPQVMLLNALIDKYFLFTNANPVLVGETSTVINWKSKWPLDIVIQTIFIQH